MILTQTWALTVAAYRELNAKKLFWVTLALSVVVVAVFASLGISDVGITILHWEIEVPGLNRETLPPDQFYLSTFVSLGIGVWLTWIATALALVSTCGTIPDLVQEGSVETMLSRPISRVRLLLTKYSLGLLFVAFQVLIFSAGSVLVFGIRAGVWEPRIFLAVPIVVLFYSYLFSICALVGLLTRSTIAALLVTALAWFGLFLANTADEMLLGFQKVAEARVELRQQRLHLEEGMATTELRRRLEESQTLPEDWAPTPAELDESSPSVVLWREQVEESQSNAESLEFWHDVAVWVKLVLPKTAETIALLDRELIDPERITVSQARENDRPRDDDERAMMLGAERTQAALRERSLAWVLGTSFAFEAFILGICCVIFARKDY